MIIDNMLCIVIIRCHVSICIHHIIQRLLQRLTNFFKIMVIRILFEKVNQTAKFVLQKTLQVRLHFFGGGEKAKEEEKPAKPAAPEPVAVPEPEEDWWEIRETLTGTQLQILQHMEAEKESTISSTNHHKQLLNQVM